MTFRLAILGLIATTTVPVEAKNRQQSPLSADSVLGKRLLSKATILEEPDEATAQLLRGRRANEGGYYNNFNQQNYDNQNGISELASLYISYTGCSSFLVPDFGDGDSGDGGGINYYNMQQFGYQKQQYGDNAYAYYDDDGLLRQNLVFLTLCSKNTCRSCSGQYAVDMVDFLDVYTEMQMEQSEYQCEYVREHCYCSNGYYESCLSTCYSNAGLSGCMQDYYGGESFQLQEYLECRGMF